MSTMIERVARTICIRLGHEPEEWATSDAIRERCRTVARAAVEAMREPDEMMTARGVTFAFSTSLGGSYRWSDYVADMHRIMIDASLAEPDPFVKPSDGGA